MALPDLARFASLGFLSNGRPIRVPDVDIFGAAGLALGFFTLRLIF